MRKILSLVRESAYIPVYAAELRGLLHRRIRIIPVVPQGDLDDLGRGNGRGVPVQVHGVGGCAVAVGSDALLERAVVLASDAIDLRLVPGVVVHRDLRLVV